MKMLKIQPYLPSKKFQKIIGSVFLIVILFFVVNFFVSRRESFKNKDVLNVTNKTIYEIRDTDSDYDGVYDWEEKFWGTNPNNKFTFEGVADGEYIENKRKALNAEGEIDLQTLTETDKFAKEFFSTFLALQTTEGVNQDDILNFSDALGSNIVNQDIPNSYNSAQVKTSSDTSSENQIDYYLRIKRLFESYQEKGIGDELEITGQNLVTYSNEGKINNINELLLIGQTYVEFAEKTMELKVPINLVDYHLAIVNASNNTGKSVIGMAKVTEDPVVGLGAVSTYQKYSGELIDSVDKLEKELEKVL